MPIQHCTESSSQCNEIWEGSKRYRYLKGKNGIIIINNKKTPGINNPGVYVNKVSILSIYNYYIINILIKLIYYRINILIKLIHNSQFFSNKEMELAIKNLIPFTLASKYIRNNSLKNMYKIYMRKTHKLH